MKSFARLILIFFSAFLLNVQSLHASNNGDEKLGKEHLAKLKKAQKISKKCMKHSKARKTPNWKKWKNSNDQIHFH